MDYSEASVVRGGGFVGIVLCQGMDCSLNAGGKACTQICATADKCSFGGGMCYDGLCKKAVIDLPDSNQADSWLLVYCYEVAGHHSAICCPGWEVIH